MSTTSGTVVQTLINAADIIDSAVSRCKISPSDLSAEDVEKARKVLHLLLLSFANRSINLWCVEQAFVPNVVGQAAYALGPGIVDISSAVFRRVTRYVATWSTSAGGNVSFLTDGNLETTCIQTIPNGVFSADLMQPVGIRMLGICAGSVLTQTLAVETSFDGAIWNRTLVLPTTSLVNGEWRWYEIDPAIPARHFRVVETAGATLSYRELVIAQSVLDIPMARFNSDDYESLPNKLITGRPLQYWFDRQRNPKMYLWPVPDSPFNCIMVRQQRHVQDVGDITNVIDIPNRWLEPTIARLAKKLILELPQADMTRYDILRQEDEDAFFAASFEERDASPVYIAPDISGYTR